MIATIIYFWASLIKDCLDIIVNYNIEEFSTLAYSILKDTDKDEFSIIIGDNTNFTLDEYRKMCKKYYLT